MGAGGGVDLGRPVEPGNAAYRGNVPPLPPIRVDMKAWLRGHPGGHHLPAPSATDAALSVIERLHTYTDWTGHLHQ